MVKKKTKILFVIYQLLRGGAERVFLNLINNLDREKFEVACLFYEPGHFCNLPKDIKIFTLQPKELIREYSRWKRIAEIMDQEEIDIVLSFLYYVNVDVILAHRLSRLKPKLMVSEHTTPSLSAAIYKTIKNLTKSLYPKIYKKIVPPQSPKRTPSASPLIINRNIRGLIKELYPRADKIIAVSAGVKKDLVKNFSLPTNKIKVIYNGIDIESVKKLAKEKVRERCWFNEDVPIIINVASLRTQKGQGYLLRAFRMVREKRDCRLAIMGVGEKENELKKLAQKLGIQNDVVFLGIQKNPFKFMARSSVFALSSVCEGFPIVILEAMACGVPVISTNCPSGPNEIIKDKVNGILVPLKDERKLAKAILSLLKNKNLSGKLSSNARKTVKKFSVRNMTEEYSRLFSKYS